MEALAAAYQRASDAADQGRWQEVRSALEPLADELAALPAAVYLLARAYSLLHRSDRALEAAARARELFSASHDDAGEIDARNLLGIVHFQTGSLAAAQAEFTAALAVAERLGDAFKRAQMANNLGNVCNLQEDADQARRYFQEALDRFRELGHAGGQAHTLHNLGIVHRDLGHHGEAESFFAQAAEAAVAAGDTQLLAVSTAGRAELLLQRGDVEGAERMARSALFRFDVNASVLGMAEVERLFGMVARHRGNLSAARAHLDRAVEYCRLHENPLVEAETRLERGELFRQLGEAEAARDDLAVAAETFERLHATRQAARARERLAAVA